MGMNVTQKLINDHLVSGEMKAGEEIGLKIDQTLTQDATGTLVMLELEAMGIDQVKTEVSAQYVDHNLIQEDHKNPDDHLFLQSATQRFGIHFSKAGNGVSHPVHMQRLGKPGKTLLGSDSHTCAAGSLGMLAIGAGGMEVALAAAGKPFYVKMPKVWGVKLTGDLPDWVSAKDVILEMLRRHGVKGGAGKIIEYYGPGVKKLSAMDRHVIANMGAELGATTSVFPSDENVQEFLQAEKRGEDWKALEADDDAKYDIEEEINMSELEPLIAKPSSPGNVVPVREVAGEPVYQTYIGSSANPGYRDFAIVAQIVKGKTIAEGLSLDVNPSSRQTLSDLIKTENLFNLIDAGGRLHQAGCNGCIGMGQAPASGRNSLRTVPRNFPGRSGTREDSVFLCSPEVAAAAALTGEITDPRDLDMDYPKVEIPEPTINNDLLDEPLPHAEAQKVTITKGPNIASIPDFDDLPDELEIPVGFKVGNDVSTDEILAGGGRVLPYRSNLPEISKFTFEKLDESYYDRSLELKEKEGGHAIIGGTNYGQGSSREHAALAPRFLGLRVVIVKDFARIHWQNLVNFGILPLTFTNTADYDKIEQGDILRLTNIRDSIQKANKINVEIKGKETIEAQHGLSERQIEIMLEGGLINWVKKGEVTS